MVSADVPAAGSELPVGEVAFGTATSDPISCTSVPSAPVRSTARIEPDWARQVPTVMFTGVPTSPAPMVIDPAPPKAVLVDTLSRSTGPLLSVSMMVVDDSGGAGVAASTPGNPGTVLQVPAGRALIGAVAVPVGLEPEPEPVVVVGDELPGLEPAVPSDVEGWVPVLPLTATSVPVGALLLLLVELLLPVEEVLVLPPAVPPVPGPVPVPAVPDAGLDAP